VIRAVTTKASLFAIEGRKFSDKGSISADTHTHSHYSLDAGAFGRPARSKDAIASVRAREFIASKRTTRQISAVPDFMVVADIRDGMGFFPQLVGGTPALGDARAAKWYDEINSGKGAQARH